ncbi:MAG: DCC1-like thiol-disulfide oxidoreductase family protein [Granulosicoccus sp.]
MSDAKNSSAITIVYDGYCPLCSAYVKYIRLRESFSSVRLMNIRQHEDLREHYRARQIDLDDGMVVCVGSVEYYGADAIHVLACLSSRSGFFNRVNSYIFRHASVSRQMYPFMRSCRNLLLFLLGRSQINKT